MIDKEILRGYAELLVKKGINPDPGQEVEILAGLDQVEFVRTVVETCYRHGAGKVVVNWLDMPVERMAQLYQTEETLSKVEDWELARWKHRADTLPCRLWIDSDDPDGMAGIDDGKYARSRMKALSKIKPFRDEMENKYQWCIAAVPSVPWAKKVFPGVSDTEAVDKLWKAILNASRANGNAIENWEQHNAEVASKVAKLNAKRFTALEYHSANGTDFKVGLMSKGIFAGAAEKDLSGRAFNPNIPSEEIFTTPERGKAEGLLVATKPLSYQGQMIESFSVRFENGKAVEVKAEKGLDVLKKMIAMDDGAAYLGECALIPCDSPINNTGILFYNTLFDENASCHVALGRGFDNCVEGFEKMTAEELKKIGVNDSIIHVDFMIGAPDLKIDGITAAGDKIPIFRNGNWA